MLYSHRDDPELTGELFKNPGSEYRGAPFWAWNADLSKIDLPEQMQCFKDMGLGGYHMHVRTGLKTKYMSPEFLGAIKQCVEWSKANDMKAYLYDEDRWPSGTCGGEVTADIEYCARNLRFTAEKQEENDRRVLLAIFDIKLDENGCLESYRRIENETEATHEVRYAYNEVGGCSNRYNGNPYVNTLSKKAIERFTQLTHKRFKDALGEDFGTVAPSIFTDEPQFTRKQQLRFAGEKKDIMLPWSDDLPETYKEACGLDLINGIPELVWELQGNEVSQIRYHYHDHVAERFAEAFADTCGRWCEENGIMLTGHMMEEPTLRSQTSALGEAMRSYRSFQLPGIDMLCQWFEYTTAKQCQSAVHQYNRQGMASELYGVTGWHYSFAGYKNLGDWQAALGVTLRVPHLSWMSMGGEAKRDYPATIFYQSPWYKEYAALEDHYARLNTALTRGKPVVNVGVIHPIESYWLHFGPMEQTASIRNQLEERFANVTKWLLFGGVDFDFISESLLPSQCETGSAPLKVGHMAYDTIIVPGCETLRSTTLERLEAFSAAGGRLIFIGDAPAYENAAISERGKLLYEKSVHVSVESSAVLDAVKEARVLSIWNLATGGMTDDLLYQLRSDNKNMWLMVAHGKLDKNPDMSIEKQLKITIKGLWKAVLYDTLTGEIRPLKYNASNGKTDIFASVWNVDSLLIKLEPLDSDSAFSTENEIVAEKRYASVPELVKYELSEPNVLLLDKAEYKLDDEEDWHPKQEILRICQEVRARMGWPLSTDIQPYAYKEEAARNKVALRFSIDCRSSATGLHIAAEMIENAALSLDGINIPCIADGWYVDKCISTVKLPDMDIGYHTIEITYPVTAATCLEWVYLTGDFGVKLQGEHAYICERPEKLGFGSITEQGFPFYGGSVTYLIPMECKNATVKCMHWRGTALKAGFDDKKYTNISYAPYACKLESPEGSHTLRIELFGNRSNSFGPVHLADTQEEWLGPAAWRTKGNRWTESYRLHEIGLITVPEISI